MISACDGAAGLLVAAVANPVSPLELAWGHTCAFWAQTCAVLAHHFAIVLFFAAVPAVERGYMLMQARSAGRGQLALMDLLVTLWRVGLCMVAVWAASSGVEWRSLSAQEGMMSAWQTALTRLGSYFANHLRMLLWELLFFALAFWFGSRILNWLVTLASKSGNWLAEIRRQEAAASILRNLILVPLAVIYLVEMARPVFRQ